MSGNFQEAKDFLSLLFQKDDYVTIGCQDPGQIGVDGRGFCTGKLCEALSYASRLLTEDKQVFFGALPRTEKLLNGRKGTKGQTAHGHVAWVDIDFQDNTDKSKEAILEIVKAFSPSPSLIVYSGNGFHVYWLFDKRYSPQEIESANKGIANTLAVELKVNADSCGNCDRMLRLPGSLNLKDLQVKKSCTVVERHPERKYKLEELPTLEVSQFDQKQNQLKRQKQRNSINSKFLLKRQKTVLASWLTLSRSFRCMYSVPSLLAIL
jgi:hypothetical protein